MHQDKESFCEKKKGIRELRSAARGGAFAPGFEINQFTPTASPFASEKHKESIYKIDDAYASHRDGQIPDGPALEKG